MGKIVKYCAACEESFAEKFAFCPNCAQPLTAFEMNPVSSGEPKIAAPEKVEPLKVEPVAEKIAPKIEPIVERSVPVLEPKKAAKKNDAANIEPIAPIVAAVPPIVETPDIAATKVFPASNQTQNYNLADIEDLEIPDQTPTVETVKAEPVPETKTFAAAAGSGNKRNVQAAKELRSNFNAAKSSDDGYHITVIEEKNSKQRNGLLLGTLVLMVTVALSSAVYSIFNKDYGIGAIGSEDSLAFVNDVAPVEIEEEEPPKPDKDDGGGGGGGGKENPEPASKGRLVSQSEKPINPPDAKLPQLTKPDIAIVQETQGKIKRPVTAERAGLPGSDNLNPSNGTGRGGGLGGGNGTGLGGGNGTGEGNGNGSGSGNGNGNGNGNGTGDGNGVRPPPPPPAPKPPVGPTEALKIISRPQPKYTDAARQNQVTGTVTLKVTFTASGQIGSIAPVNGLPYGLTEQAIAAARQIRFEPPKRNGVPYGVSKTVTYTFTIY